MTKKDLIKYLDKYFRVFRYENNNTTGQLKIYDRSCWKHNLNKDKNSLGFEEAFKYAENGERFFPGQEGRACIAYALIQNILGLDLRDCYTIAIVNRNATKEIVYSGNDEDVAHQYMLANVILGLKNPPDSWNTGLGTAKGTVETFRLTYNRMLSEINF